MAGRFRLPADSGDRTDDAEDTGSPGFSVAWIFFMSSTELIGMAVDGGDDIVLLHADIGGEGVGFDAGHGHAVLIRREGFFRRR